MVDPVPQRHRPRLRPHRSRGPLRHSTEEYWRPAPVRPGHQGRFP